MPTVYVGARWASGNAKDLPTLLQSTGVAFVGKVLRLREQRYEDLISPGPFTSLDVEGEGKPSGAEGPPPFPISLFDVEVERSLLGDLQAGAIVTVQQAGGIGERSDGTSIRLVLEFDEPLETGSTYLFFAIPSPNDDGTLVTSPIARLKLEANGRFFPLSAWSHLGALRQLSGLGVQEAASRITEAVEE